MRIFSLLLTVLVILAILSLSQAAGRLLGFDEYLSGLGVWVLAALLALANALLIQRVTMVGKSRSTTNLIVIAYLLLVPGVGLASAYLSYASTPPILVEALAVTATVKDSEGKTAHVEIGNQLKVLRSGLDQILWVRNLGSTGFIKDVAVRDLDAEYSYQVVEQAGHWQVRLLFPKRSQKGQHVTFGLVFNVVGSEPEEKDYWVHNVAWPTRNLQITLIVPKERACNTVEAASEDALQIGIGRREEHPPFLSDDNTRLTWTKANPEEGRAYIVTCY